MMAIADYGKRIRKNRTFVIGGEGRSLRLTMGMTDNNLCKSCINLGCEFQSGIVRTECDFYMPPYREKQMGMTIDDAIRYFKDMEKACCCGTEQATIAIDTMRKYQKIQEIVKSWKSDTWTYGVSYDCMVKISEVLEDG